MSVLTAFAFLFNAMIGEGPLDSIYIICLDLFSKVSRNCSEWIHLKEVEYAEYTNVSKDFIL